MDGYCSKHGTLAVHCTDCINETMLKFKVGQYLKIENRVFCFVGVTEGRKFIPNGWPIDKDGTAANPTYCEIYKGATSVLVGV